jgi:hypothetical protein
VSDPVHILKAHTLTVDTGGTSTQKFEEDWLGTPNDAIEPPVPLDALAELSKINPIRSACIEAIAQNTVGLGYDLVVEENNEREVGDATDDARAARSLLETLAARDERLDHPTFTELLKAVKTDEEEVGIGGIEISRDKRTGEITGLFHVPGRFIRRTRDRKGWLAVRPAGDLDSPVRFYNFGEKVVYANGQPTNRLQTPGRGWARNELLVWKLYSSESRDYGMPRDAAMTLDYLADKLAGESNVSFFDSSGTPPTILFVQGEESKDGKGRVTFKVPRETSDRIAATLKSDAGHRHRVAIIPVPPGTATKDVKLGEVSDRDVGFTQFRADITGRTIGAFRLQPVFIAALGDAGRYTAEVQRAITLEQLFDPEQRRYEARIGETLLRELGFGHLRLDFRRLAVEDDAHRRESANQLAEAGTITRRELRRAHGHAPMPEAAKADTTITFEDEQYQSAEPEPGQVPYGWNDRIVNTGRPRGAENRRDTPGTDNRGLDDGIGGRKLSENGADPATARA